MKRLLYLLFAVAVLTAADAADAGWGAGGSPTVVGPAFLGLPAPQYLWSEAPEIPGQWNLHDGNRWVGSYDPATGVYLPILAGGGWGDACAPPLAPPRRPEPDCDPARGCAMVGGVQNFGLEVDKLQGKGAEVRYKLGDREVPREAAVDAMKNGVPEFAGKFRLTLIGTKDETAPALKAWAESEDVKDVRERVLVSSVPPDHWWLKDTTTGKVMFESAGHPTIYFQAADGKVLHRQDGYTGPADFQAIRKAVDGYDAKKDPDRRKVDAAGGGGEVFGWLAAALAGVFGFNKLKEWK